jgi:hypothetical protein
MKNDLFILTAVESFERLFGELFMGNPKPPETPSPWETELVIDGPPVVFPALPYFRFTRRSATKLKELGGKERYEFKAYCTPGGAKKLKKETGYQKFLAVVGTIEIASLKDITDGKPKSAAVEEVQSDLFIPVHPEYQGTTFKEVWDKSQHICPHLVEAVGGAKIPVPADLFAHVTTSLYALSTKGFDVSKINVYRAFAREAHSMKFRNKSVGEIIQLFAEQEVGITIDITDPRKHRQFPAGHHRQAARNLFDFMECLGECRPEDFTPDHAKKFEVWLKLKRKKENASIKKKPKK